MTVQETAVRRGRDRTALLSPLFKVAENPPRVRPAVLLLVLLAGTALCLARQPGVGALDTVWAEDGTIFLSQAWRGGLWDELWAPYAGYVHLVPRLLAEFAALFPVSWASEILALEAAALTVAMAVLVFHASAGQLRSTIARVVVSAPVVILWLGQGDLPNAIANLHWSALYVAFWMLLWLPRRAAGVWLATAVLLLTASSDILVVVYLPLALARVLVIRGWRGWSPSLALVAGLAVQGVVRLGTDAPRALTPEFDPVRLVGALAARLVPLSVVGERWGSDPGSSVRFLVAAAIAWLVVLAVLGVAWRVPGERRLFAAVAAAHAVVLYLLPCVLTGVMTARYAAVPAMLLVAAATAILSEARRASERAVVLACAVLLALVAAVNFRVHNERAEGPGWDATLDRYAAECGSAGGLVEVPITPEGWTAAIPCRDLPRP